VILKLLAKISKQVERFCNIRVRGKSRIGVTVMQNFNVRQSSVMKKQGSIMKNLLYVRWRKKTTMGLKARVQSSMQDLRNERSSIQLQWSRQVNDDSCE
jgi:hypothetical protein